MGEDAGERTQATLTVVVVVVVILSISVPVGSGGHIQVPRHVRHPLSAGDITQVT
jgi:hypothetical protein